MSNEMKLIMELCGALGFNVEVKADYQERRVSKTLAMELNKPFYRHGHELALCVKGDGQMLDIDENDMYLARLTAPIVSYKLTPKTHK